MRVVVAPSCTFAAYLLVAGTLSATEIFTGLVLSGFAAASMLVFDRISERRFRFTLAHARPWGRALSRVPAATLRTGTALAGALFSGVDDRARADEIAFRRGARDAPTERARRATAVLAASLAPNSFVVRAEPGRDTALLHGIERRRPPSDPEWLA